LKKKLYFSSRRGVIFVYIRHIQDAFDLSSKSFDPDNLKSALDAFDICQSGLLPLLASINQEEAEIKH
ncbi:hypothetical protein, partial [Persicobacter diffluens]|uniref:hypothetical protein n=1 Tax=Persicobacter diffluens TaxID=981 RepID=UPI0030C67B3A